VGSGDALWPPSTAARHPLKAEFREHALSFNTAAKIPLHQHTITAFLSHPIPHDGVGHSDDGNRVAPPSSQGPPGQHGVARV